MKNIFRILAVILLGLSVASCELFSPKLWREVSEYRRKRGIECYKNGYGNIFCEDIDGNPAY